MMKRAWGLAVVTAVMLALPDRARAAAITIRPDTTLTGLPGETLGWGYDITADAGFDLSFIGISADVLAGDASISALAFDFPVVLAGTQVQRDYDPIAGLGLVELTLSPLLAPGSTVTGRVLLDYMVIDTAGILADEFRSVELTVTASTPVPEPSTLLLMSSSGLLLMRRRRPSRP